MIMGEKCRCGHDRGSHLMHKFEDGEVPPIHTKCKIDNCNCEGFEEVGTCKECGELLKTSQYARVKKEGGLAAKAHEDLVCRNYPNCSKAEKETKNE